MSIGTAYSLSTPHNTRLEKTVDTPAILEILGSADRASLVLLTLHNLLQEAKLEDLARLAWVAYLEASQSADTMGVALGLTE